MIVVGTIGLAGAAGAWSIPERRSQDDWLGAIFLGALALLLIARGFTGEWGKRQVRVDVPAGKLMLVNGDVYPLDELGALTLEKTSLPRRRSTDTIVHEYRLRAANVKKYYVYFSVYESDTLGRRKALEEAILQCRLRKILERPTSDGSAFRGGPDALAEIRGVGETSHVAAALKVLEKDPDAHVRRQAQKLVTQL